MFGSQDEGTIYKDAFDKLSYKNKVELNEISDYIDQKKLNRLAKKQVLTRIAASALDCQNRNEPLDNLFNEDLSLFCDKMCEGAPKASFVEKLFALIRNTAGYSIIFGLVVLANSISKGNSSFIIEGIYALQMVGGAFVALLCFPLVCFRDGMHMPGNIIFPRNAVSLSTFIHMAAYSLLCIACAVSYTIVSWIYPNILLNNGFGSFKLNVLAWVIISALAFVAFFALERYTVKQNCEMYCHTT